jgi:glycosyltransferase involved in cell wall biosynthesis
LKPRVSVLLPVRNGLPWLREALESLAVQTMPDFEIVVLEDGSTDGTADFLASWGDDRMRVVSTGGVGIAAALNIGLGEASAPLVARQDADDASAPERLAVQTEYLNIHSDIGVLATVADYIDGDGSAVDNDWVRTVRRQQDVASTPAQIRELMPLTCCVTHGSIVARAAVLTAAGGYRQSMAPAEDYDLWLRLLPETQLAKLPERLYRYRVHAGQVSAQAREAQLLKTLTAKYEYVRRVCARLPARARLAIVGAGRGADAYRMLAPAHGFDVMPEPSMRRSCDAVVVANFADVPEYERAFGRDRHGEILRLGNFFVPRRVAAWDCVAGAGPW